MKLISAFLFFCSVSVFAQPAPIQSRTVVIKQSQGGSITTSVTLDGTKPWYTTPTPDNKITVNQGSVIKVFPNSNPLTVQFSGAWPKCGPKPADATQPGMCPAGQESHWTQSHGWTLTAFPQCWVPDAWMPQTPPPGGCVVVPVCPPQPPTESRPGSPACPAGTHGTYTQTRSYTPANPPVPPNGCWVAGPWTPAGPPAGTCVPDTPPPPPGQFRLDLSYVNMSSPEYARFKAYVDAGVNGNFGWGFSAADPAYMYKLTGGTQYRDLAIRLVEADVVDAETEIAAGRNPPASYDSYLEIGGIIGPLAMVYSWCNDALTTSQKTRWANYANQAVWNVWHASQASWGGRSAPWNAWSVNDPLNNYYYSFMRASTWWGLAANPPELRYGSGNSKTLMDYLRTDRWPLLTTAYAGIPGGGSLEGSGYGSSHRGLFELYQFWKDSGEGDLSNVNTHMTNSILTWLHMTVPTMDFFYPTGDQARVSEPEFYDYQRSLVLEAYHQTNNAAVMNDGGWLLQHLDNQNMQSGFNYRYNLIPDNVASATPSALGYRAPETGVTCARTSWTTTATLFCGLFGTYNQSHAHQEQGGFMLYKNTWLAVTNNIWSHSGLQQSTRDKNIVRFERNGSVVGQTYNRSVSVSNYTQAANGDMHLVANLTPMYSSGINWTRAVDFVGGVLTVNDQMTLASGTTGTFQVNTPVRPTVSGNIITAGGLRIEVQLPANPTVALVDMHTVDSDYNSGWRVDIGGSSTQYRVVLSAQ